MGLPLTKEDLLGTLPVIMTSLVLLTQSYGGISWGDGLEFVAVAHHLGIAHPPGYPLLTFCLYLFSFLPFDDPYFSAVLYSRLTVVAIIWGVFFLARSVALSLGYSRCLGRGLAAILASACGFSAMLWPATHVVEAYTTATVFVVWTAVALFSSDQKPVSPRRLLVAATLGGLATASHLTALALAPMLAFAAWPMLRERKVLPIVGSIVVYLAIPALLYLTLLFRAPSPDAYGIYWGGMTTSSEWLNHLRGGEYRQFQFLMLNPSTPFTVSTWVLFAFYRTVEMVKEAGAMFFGRGPASFAAGIVLLSLMITGVYTLMVKGERRYLWAVLSFVVPQLLFLLLYNIPDFSDYLMMSLMLLMPLMLVGLFSSVDWVLTKTNGDQAKKEKITTLLTGLFLLSAILTNIRGIPPASNDLAESWKNRLLPLLPEGAALITSRDADVYTMFYLQHAKNERQDIFVYGANFVRFPWFRYSLNPDDTRRDAVGFAPGSPSTIEQFFAQLSELAIDPMLAEGPVYYLPAMPQEIQVLSQRYQVLPVGDLLTENDWRVIEANSLVNFPPPTLFEIRPLR